MSALLTSFRLSHIAIRAPTHMTFYDILICSLALGVTFFATPTAAHTWIEEMQIIDSNGSYVGDRGYSRGYVARTDPTFTGFSDNYLLPQNGVRINSSDSLCHPSQRSSNYTNPAYPMLKAAPGDYVAMKYLENGHVTLPHTQLGKPAHAGTVYVYGTHQPAADEKLVDVLAWTADGSGGNGKGFLMTAQNFDDGRCHQINCGNISTYRQIHFPSHQIGQPMSTMEQWCETDLHLPTNVTAGTLTVYWVWSWPTSANADCTYPDGKDEYYTTCSDMQIVDESSQKVLAAAGSHTLVQEAPQSTAVSTYQSRTAAASSPVMVYMKGITTVDTTASADASFNSACASSRSAYVSPITNAVQSCAVITSFATDEAVATNAVPATTVVSSSLAAVEIPSIATSTPDAAPATATVTVTNEATVFVTGAQTSVVYQTSYLPAPSSQVTSSSLGAAISATTAAAPTSYSAPSNASPSSLDTLSIPTISTVGVATSSGSAPSSYAPAVGANGTVIVRRGHPRLFFVG